MDHSGAAGSQVRNDEVHHYAGEQVSIVNVVRVFATAIRRSRGRVAVILRFSLGENPSHLGRRAPAGILGARGAVGLGNAPNATANKPVLVPSPLSKEERSPIFSS